MSQSDREHAEGVPTFSSHLSYQTLRQRSIEALGKNQVHRDDIECISDILSDRTPNEPYGTRVSLFVAG